MADIDCEDPELNKQLKLKIRQRFINQVGPFKVVDLIHQVDKNVLTDEDIEHIKICTRNDGNFVGAKELFKRLTQYRGWFACLISALRQVLPELATKLAGDHDEVLKRLSAERSHEVHLREGKGCTSLLEAASRGHVGCLLDLLSGQADLNSKNERGETAVYLAAAGGHTDCLEILIQAGCNVKLRNKSRDSPLYVATKNGFSECVRILINALTDTAGAASCLNVLNVVNKHAITPVWAAAAKGHVECLNLLLRAGASVSNCSVDRPDGITPLMAAAVAGEEKCVHMLLEAGADMEAVDMYGRTPLFIAAMEGKVKCLQVLMEAGADINNSTFQGESPLFVSAGYRHSECVSLLVSAEADVHMKSKKGQTALMKAAACGDEESLKTLVDAGSNLNTQDNDGKTALIYATISMFDLCVQILVENGADIHLRDKTGKTALHHAVGFYCLLLTILVELGADVNAADNNGETPLMEAVRGNNREVVQYLIMKDCDVQKTNNKGQTALAIAESNVDGWICANLLRRNKRTELSYEEAEKVMGSNKEAPDRGTQCGIDHVDTLNRSQEVEYYPEAEDNLRKCYSDCKKNPGHVGFIPVTEFDLSHLPQKYCDQRIVDVIKAEAELAVRLLVNYTSAARPKGYSAWNLRGKKRRRVGSGWVTYGVSKHKPEDNEKCPCPDCENSAKPKMEWMEVRIKTAMHVVYDSSEAKTTVVHIFADLDKPEEMHKLYGFDVGFHNQDDDQCDLHAATHDLRLYSYLKSMVQQRGNMWRSCSDVDNDFVAIVSHPHGCSKQITMGEWTTRYPNKEVSFKSKYIYNVPTCPGSSGAPVLVFGKNTSMTVHPHSGASQDPGHNLSGSSSGDAPFTFTMSPITGSYHKAFKRKDGTGKYLPMGWDSLFEAVQERPESPVQPLYDYHQRPPPPQAGT